MQEDERDLLEVLIFDEMEETVGTWLRAIIRHLEKERMVTRRNQQNPTIPRRKTLRGTLLYQKRRPKSAKPACSTALDRRQVLPISGRPAFGKLV